MFWYFVQLLVQLIIAFLLGLLVGWLLWARTLRKRTQLYVRETRGLRGEIEGFRANTSASDGHVAVPAAAQKDASAAKQHHDVEMDKAQADVTALRGQVESLTTEQASLASAHKNLTDAHAKLSDSYTGLQDSHTTLSDAHTALGADHAALVGELAALKASPPPPAATKAVNEKAVAVKAVAVKAVAVKAVTPKPARPDDLKRVEGVGPKMQQALRAVGIETFAQLASTPQGELQSAIDAAKLMSLSVGTWAKQARFLADGDEAGFVAYIEQLVGGVEPGTTGER